MNIKTFTTGYDFATTANAQDMDIIDAQVLEANTNLLNELPAGNHQDRHGNRMPVWATAASAVWPPAIWTA